MNRSLLYRSSLVTMAVTVLALSGCPGPSNSGTNGDNQQESTANADGEQATSADQTPVATADADDVAAAQKLLDGLGGNASYALRPGNRMTEILVRDGSKLSGEDIALFGRLTDLESLRIMNFRELDDEMVSQLTGLKELKTLALTNSGITDAAVETIVDAYPELTNLDLSSNTVITNSALKKICELEELERLTLIQDNINDAVTGNLSKLKKLRVLDIRGCLASDLTMEVLGVMPKLEVLKHRNPSVSDYGIEFLAQSPTLSEYDIEVDGPNESMRSLLMQDFDITDEAGQYLAIMPNLTELEIFRCQGFGSDGLLALAGTKLTRLKLRDLPEVGDAGLAVFEDLSELRRLELHEVNSVTDEGLKNLAALKKLEVLDIWSIPEMSDATLDVIAQLPNLTQLSIRTTAVTDGAVEKLLAMPKLTKLTFKDNAAVTDEGRKKLEGKKWEKLEI
jgi:Leucine-rich repeat (LRR) protein